MILIDSSVLIRAIGSKRPSAAVEELAWIIELGLPFAICPYVYQEVLQGVADEAAFSKTQLYLDTQEWLWLPDNLDTYRKAAKMYWTLRRKGITVRSTIDVLIALTAIEHEAFLLHEDTDFDQIAKVFPELKIANLRNP
ncbi:MAG: PIN domain-containing protein [Propionibacteriaceae bacterium]|nr:PIN domain-containing protein [Propionibacteriaceae bacterium]